MSDFDASQHPRNTASGRFVPDVKDADTVRELGATPYPTVPVESWETIVVDEDGLDGLLCLCGNDASVEGFGEGDAHGKFLGSDGDPVTSICHSCGRVYRNADIEAGKEGDQVAAIIHFDQYTDEFQDAQAAYWVENGYIEAGDVAKLTRRVRPSAERGRSGS